MSIFLFFGNFMGFSYLLFIVISSDPYYKKVEYKQIIVVSLFIQLGIKMFDYIESELNLIKGHLLMVLWHFGHFFFAAHTYVIQALVYHFRLAEGWYDKRASVGPHASH